MSIGSLTLDFLHSRYKCTTVLLTKISPVAALPGNPKRSALTKASFQEQTSSYLPTSSVTYFLFPDAKSANQQIINGL